MPYEYSPGVFLESREAVCLAARRKNLRPPQYGRRSSWAGFLTRSGPPLSVALSLYVSNAKPAFLHFTLTVIVGSVKGAPEASRPKSAVQPWLLTMDTVPVRLTSGRGRELLTVDELNLW
jgi:hypothetical protein